jgi:hypothetical protein
MTRYPLYVLFAAASLVLLARVVMGPFDLAGLSVHSPLNAEALIAVSFLLALLLRSRRLQEVSAESIPPAAWPWILPACAILITIAFVPGIGAPLLHDSYVHVENSATRTFAQILHASLIRPQPGDLFFRPLGNISYWLDYRWAGTEPALWHSWNVALHLANCGLVWLLARRVGMSRFPAIVAALVFALHGTRPEVVAWAAARFDLLAAFFTLAALLTINRFPLMATFTVLALLSKEAAYGLPFLVLLLIPFSPDADRRRILKATAGLIVICAIVFAWRSWFLGGIGGYTTVSGAPSIFQFSALRSAKALLYRQWAILFFPINWSRSPGFVLQTATVVMVVTAAGFLRFSHGPRRLLAASLAFVALAALPAQHLLLIGTDLSGARVLYLPAVGLALFWGFAVDGCHWRFARYALPAGLLLFQTAALEHNLGIWRDIAFLSQRTCRALGAEMARDPRPVAVSNLPATRDGVFFLSNGFPQCVAINTGQGMDRIHVYDTPADARRFRWSDETVRLEEVR